MRLRNVVEYLKSTWHNVTDDLNASCLTLYETLLTYCVPLRSARCVKQLRSIAVPPAAIYTEDQEDIYTAAVLLLHIAYSTEMTLKISLSR